MSNAKSISSPLDDHFRLSSKIRPSTLKEKHEMDDIPYSLAILILMYAMVSTRLDIALAVGVMSGFMRNPSKTHWPAV